MVKKLKLGQSSKTPIVTKRKHPNCDKNQNLNCGKNKTAKKNQKLKQQPTKLKLEFEL